MTTVQQDRLATLATGLRELADWLDSRPGVDLRDFETLSLDRSTQGTDDENEAEVKDWAAAMGVTAEWTIGGHLVATRSFGELLSLRVVHCPSDGMAEYDARNALARAARWVYVCADGTQSPGHESEADARVALAVHMVESGCPAGHLVRLVSGELAGSAR
jgi:hypothetical protein